MKKIVLIFTLLICSKSLLFSQDNPGLVFEKDASSGDNFYEEVVTMNGVGQEELYKRAKNWVMANMKTEDNNISFEDKEFKIVNSAGMKVDPKSFITYAINDGIMDFKFHVWVKEGKYKLRVDNITYHLLINNGDSKSTRSESYNDVKDNKFGRYLRSQADEKLYSLVYVFKKAMKNEATKEKNDW